MGAESLKRGLGYFRFADRTLSLLAPTFLLIAAAVRLTSPGPVSLCRSDMATGADASPCGNFAAWWQTQQELMPHLGDTKRGQRPHFQNQE